MAQFMLDRAERASLNFTIGRENAGERKIQFQNGASLTDEQREVATDIVMFGIGYPRNFATMARMVADKADQDSER